MIDTRVQHKSYHSLAEKLYDSLILFTQANYSFSVPQNDAEKTLAGAINKENWNRRDSYNYNQNEVTKIYGKRNVEKLKLTVYQNGQWELAGHQPDEVVAKWWIRAKNI